MRENKNKEREEKTANCGLEEILERLFEYLKRSLKIAYKSIFFNFKQYIYFFIALLIVQMFYGIMTISAYNNETVERDSAIQEYNYDIMLSQLSDAQKNHIVEYGGSSFTGDRYYEIVGEPVKSDADVDPYYDVRIAFTGEDSSESLAKFKTQYYDKDNKSGSLLEVPGGNPDFFYYESPRIQIESNIIASNASYWAISGLLLALSIFLMTSLYNIRVNQYKFTYGVYMTYGADFKKLFGTAFWEMFMISCITFIPSVILSTVVVYLIYLPSGFAFAFNPLVFLQVFIFSLIVVLFAVFFPMRIMAIRQPMSLIVTQDNSNLVISPKYSINVFKKKFPTKYELYSAWRFRKYSVNLLATAIVFCAFFIMGLYLANIYTTDLEYNRPDFKIDLEESFMEYSDDMSEELYAIEGIDAVQVADNSMEASDLASHILVDKSDVKFLASGVVNYKGTGYKGDGDMRACSSVVYNATDAEQIKVLETFYNYEGDLNSIANEKTVIIGDSISNITTFKYEVGDKIWVAKKTGGAGVDSNLTGAQLLRAQIEKFKYSYEEYTIGAILTDIPSGDMPIFFNETDYKSVTGKPAEAYKLNIYIDQTLEGEALAKVDEDIRAWGRDYGNVSVENTYQVSRNSVAYDKHNNELYICISILLLGISPIMWFFSQSLYYMKRESEFNILQAMGAMVKEIRQIYVQGGLIMAGLSLVVSFVLSFLGSYGLFYVYNVLMPYFSGENVRYAFYMPWYALLISIVVSVGCGFLSAYLPFKSYIKNRATLENGGAGGSDD
ncbi:MAG: ABC transporter permease [Ruminococcaceae bacterium]|nr:ABC transporter permease [Oscillospiraceae bacterium]